jgi:hypothetical protein
VTQSVSLNVNGKAVDVQIDDPRRPVSAAISSAVFDAVGVRLRSVPFSPKKTLAAIKAV